MSGPKNAAADGKGAAAAPPPMPDGRIDFDDEQFALLETRPSHGEFKRLFKNFGHLSGAEIADAFDESSEVVGVLLRSWKVKDRDGNWLETDPASIERCPAEIFMAIYRRCSEIFKAIPTPKA